MHCVSERAGVLIIVLAAAMTSGCTLHGAASAMARSPASCWLVRPQPKRDSDCGTACLVVGHPEAAAMRFNDRSANGEPHSHPVGFSREERLECALRILETRSGVANLDAD